MESTGQLRPAPQGTGRCFEQLREPIGVSEPGRSPAVAATRLAKLVDAHLLLKSPRPGTAPADVPDPKGEGKHGFVCIIEWCPRRPSARPVARTSMGAPADVCTSGVRDGPVETSMVEMLRPGAGCSAGISPCRDGPPPCVACAGGPVSLFHSFVSPFQARL